MIILFLVKMDTFFFGIEASAVEFSKIAVGPLDWDYTNCDWPKSHNLCYDIFTKYLSAAFSQFMLERLGD